MLKSHELKFGHELLERVKWLDASVDQFMKYVETPELKKQVLDQVGLDLTRILSTLKQESRVR